MIYALIENGIVAEIILPVDGFDLKDRFHPEIVALCVECPNLDVQGGWTYQNGKFAAPSPIRPSEVSTPVSISRRQFFQQAAVVKKITNDEALAAVRTGAIPAAIQAIIDAQPADKKFGYEMLISGADSFLFAHPMTAIIAKAMDLTADSFFRDAALI